MPQGKFGRPAYYHKPQLCETCQNFAGGEFDECSWTSVGLDGKVKFQPVPGWTAEKVPYTGGRQSTRNDFTYQISACPLYVPDAPRKDKEVTLCE